MKEMRNYKNEFELKKTKFFSLSLQFSTFFFFVLHKNRMQILLTFSFFISLNMENRLINYRVNYIFSITQNMTK